MSAIVSEGVYLITSTTHKNHFLVNGPDPINKVSATSQAAQCWRVKHNIGTNRWTIRAIPTLYKGHLNYTGESGFYLAVGNEAQKPTVITDRETWHTLTQTLAADGSYHYRISNNADNLWLTVSFGPTPEITYNVHDWPRHEDQRQTWRFQKMP